MTTAKRFKLSIIFSLLGAVLSVISIIHHVEIKGGFSRGPSFCSISKEFDCDRIVRSAFSEVFGLSLGVWGLIFYLAFLLLSLKWEERQESRRDVAFVLSLAASAASIILFLVSKIYVGAFCLICMSMYAVNFILFALHLRSDPLSSIGRGLYTIAIRYPAALFDNSLQGKKALKNFVILGIGFCISVLLPLLIHRVLESTTPPAPSAVKLWSASPVQNINNSSNGVNRDYSRGSGKIQIVEFADLECPACRRLYPEIEKILEEYKDKVHFTFRNYPLDKACNPALPESIHESACFAAYFTRCAGEQDKFWDSLHFVMTLSSNNRSRNEAIEIKEATLSGSKSLGLDEEALTECLSAERTKKKISDDIAEGDRLSLQGTPSIWINGQRVDDPEYRVIKEIIDHLLK